MPFITTASTVLNGWYVFESAGSTELAVIISAEENSISLVTQINHGENKAGIREFESDSPFAWEGGEHGQCVFML